MQRLLAAHDKNLQKWSKKLATNGLFRNCAAEWCVSMDSACCCCPRSSRLSSALHRFPMHDDTPPTALRDIAMAQLGEHPRACELLWQAGRGFRSHEELARAHFLVAGAEVALTMHDFNGVLRRPWSKNSVGTICLRRARRENSGKDC